MSEYAVMGLDIAAANSGLCIAEAHYPHYSFCVTYEEGLHHPMDDFRNRIDAANYIGFLAKEHNVDFVVMEDYAMRFGKTNTSGFQYGEVGGMVRKVLYELEIPIYIIPPTSMRSLMDVPPKSDKEYLQERAKERLSFESKASTKKKRSDITDAVIHAYIGSLVHILRNNELEYELTESEKKILLGNKKITGLKDREGIYYATKKE